MGRHQLQQDDLDASDDTGADWHSFEGTVYGTASITMKSMVRSATPDQGTQIEDTYAAVLRDTAAVIVVGKSLTISAHGGVLVYTRTHRAPYKGDFLAPIPPGPPGPPSASVRPPLPVASPSRPG